MVERFLPSHSSRIDRIPVRWNHSDYRGVPLGWGAGWAVTRKQEVDRLEEFINAQEDKACLREAYFARH